MISKAIIRPQNCPRATARLNQASANVLRARGYGFSSLASQASEFLQEGEYIDFGEPTILATPKPYRVSKKRNLADEIFEGSVSKGTLKETEDSMQQNTQRILDKLKIGSVAQSVVTEEPVRPAAEDQDGQMSILRQNREDAVKKVASMDLKAAATDRKRYLESSKAEEQAQIAYHKLVELRDFIGEESTFLKDVTLNDLRKSTQLQSLIIDYNFLHLSNSKKPKNSFVRDVETQKTPINT